MRPVLVAAALAISLTGGLAPGALAQSASFGDGVWVVGRDIAPGTYRSDGGDYCYWERLSGLSGEFADIIANDNPAGPTVVTIDSGDVAFATSGCGTWTPGGSSTSGAGPAGTFGDGLWVVGSDIEPGTYRSAGGEYCYWARLSGLSGEFGDIIANENPSGPTVVTIAPGDAAFSTQGCGTWAPAGSSGSGPVSSFGDGLWVVGSDILAGRYRAPGGEYCYWERLSGLSGEFGDIIANENPAGQTVVEIAGGDTAFSTSGCGTWAPF